MAAAPELAVEAEEAGGHRRPVVRWRRSGVGAAGDGVGRSGDMLRSGVWG